MKSKLFGIFILGLALVPMASADYYALPINENIASSWNFGPATESSFENYTAFDPREIALAGGTGNIAAYAGVPDGNNNSRGFVGMVAQKIVAHGGYFCPTQIQCSTNSGNNAWTEFYAPRPISSSEIALEYMVNNSEDGNRCFWLCESGYTGENCAAYSDDIVNNAFCDDKTTAEKFSQGYSLQTSEDAVNLKTLYAGLDQWGGAFMGGLESNVVVALFQYEEHAVFAAPVYIECDKNNGVTSWVNKLGLTSMFFSNTTKRLCPQGYVAEGPSECVPKPQCANATTASDFCVGYVDTAYNETIHDLYVEGGCAKFRCEADNHGFADFSDQEYNCVPCTQTGSESWNTGISSITNECVFCDDLEYFNPTTSTCDELIGLSRLDLQYGIGETNNTTSLSEQCWTITDPVNYRNCILGTTGGTLSKNDGIDIGTLTVVPSN